MAHHVTFDVTGADAADVREAAVKVLRSYAAGYPFTLLAVDVRADEFSVGSDAPVLWKASVAGLIQDGP